jgi:hypothetical protein
MMKIRIVVRCEKDPDHAKVLEMRGRGLEYARDLAGLLDGTSDMYIYKPGPDSPIGKCGLCGAKVYASVQTWEVPDAQPE